MRQEWMLWCFGSALFAIVVAHFGINYMAQLIMGFFPADCLHLGGFVRSRHRRRLNQRSCRGKKWFEWAPLPVEADAASYEAKPLAQPILDQSKRRKIHSVAQGLTIHRTRVGKASLEKHDE